MSYTVKVFPSAQKEMDQAYCWIVKHTPKKADLWHFELMEAITSLENFPHRCSLARENEYFRDELRQLICGDYRIVFTVKDEEVHVIHVRHTSRRTAKPRRSPKRKK